MSPVVRLASASPRRLALMEGAGWSVRVQPSNVDETPLPGEAPREYVLRVARAKAGEGGGLVVAADTVVHLGGRILGKPAGAAEAERMLRELSGRSHRVTTGLCVRRDGRVRLRAVRTEVRFRHLEPAEIRAYVAGGEPMDKAGAYAIQGGAASFVREIRGSYSSVVGLPLAELVEELAALGVPPPLAGGRA